MHLGLPFLPWWKGQADHQLWHSAQGDDLCFDARVQAQTFPPKTGYDIIRASDGNIALMLGILNDDIHISL